METPQKNQQSDKEPPRNMPLPSVTHRAVGPDPTGQYASVVLGLGERPEPAIYRSHNSVWALIDTEPFVIDEGLGLMIAVYHAMTLGGPDE